AFGPSPLRVQKFLLCDAELAHIVVLVVLIRCAAKLKELRILDGINVPEKGKPEVSRELRGREDRTVAILADHHVVNRCRASSQNTFGTGSTRRGSCVNKVARIESNAPGHSEATQYSQLMCFMGEPRDEVPHGDFIPDVRKSLWLRYLYLTPRVVRGQNAACQHNVVQPDLRVVFKGRANQLRTHTVRDHMGPKTERKTGGALQEKMIES